MNLFRRGVHETDAVRVRFDILVREHLRPLYAFVRLVFPHADADAVVNETFASAWQRLDQIGEGHERNWLRAAARNHVYNTTRGERRWRALNDRVAQLEPVASVPPPDSGPAVDLDVVLQSLGSLERADRELLLMTALEDLGPDDLAEILGVRPHTATMRLSRARARLRAVVEASDHDPQIERGRR